MKIGLFILMSFVAQCVLAQEGKYTLVLLHKNVEADKITKEESNKIMEGHMTNINSMAKEGKLLATGPFDGGGGLFIMNTVSKDDISQWLSADPGIQAKRWHVEMLPYNPQYGSLCKVSEPYEMISYSFIRFDAVVSKFTASNYPQIMKKHNDYIKQLTLTGNVVTAADFGLNEGGILVMKGEVQRELFESDPGVQEGLLELTVKKLYIAKGSFCEK